MKVRNVSTDGEKVCVKVSSDGRKSVWKSAVMGESLCGSQQ